MTLSRKSELLLARWRDVNLEVGEWLVPEGNAKTAKPHIVYLSTQAAEMFRELKALAGDSELVLPGRGSIVRPFAKNALNKALEGLTFDMDPLTIHDLRENWRYASDGEWIQQRRDRKGPESRSHRDPSRVHRCRICRAAQEDAAMVGKLRGVDRH